jgi:hypothetical protein
MNLPSAQSCPCRSSVYDCGAACDWAHGRQHMHTSSTLDTCDRAFCPRARYEGMQRQVGCTLRSSLFQGVVGSAQWQWQCFVLSPYYGRVYDASGKQRRRQRAGETARRTAAEPRLRTGCTSPISYSPYSEKVSALVSRAYIDCAGCLPS